MPRCAGQDMNGDVIVGLGGVPISNGMVLRSAVQRGAGSEVEVEVVRDGKRKVLDATLDGATRGVPRSFERERIEIPWSDGHGRVVLRPDEGEFDDLHLRIDDLEQQLMEMAERLEAATSLIEERLESIER